jgi:glycosyltransferase involved in cell wall biosynthesis
MPPPMTIRPALVSIGLPTFNRERLLRNAVESILAQDHREIELVISDNASTDGTEAYCREVAARDPRVRYMRQARNIGGAANYVAVFQASTGPYFMNMADDDAPDPNYVSECMKALDADPEVVVAAGRSLFYRGEQLDDEGAPTNILQADREDRVVSYYSTVAENAIYQGIIRRDVLLRTPAMPHVLAGDWLYMAWIAFQGKLVTVPGTAIRKQRGGTSVTRMNIVKVLGKPRIQGVFPNETIILLAFGDACWGSPVFAPLGRLRRTWLAFRVAGALAHRWYVMAVPRWLARRRRRATARAK